MAGLGWAELSKQSSGLYPLLGGREGGKEGGITDRTAVFSGVRTANKMS